MEHSSGLRVRIPDCRRLSAALSPQTEGVKPSESFSVTDGSSCPLTPEIWPCWKVRKPACTGQHPQKAEGLLPLPGGQLPGHGSQGSTGSCVGTLGALSCDPASQGLVGTQRPSLGGLVPRNLPGSLEISVALTPSSQASANRLQLTQWPVEGAGH